MVRGPVEVIVGGDDESPGCSGNGSVSVGVASLTGDAGTSVAVAWLTVVAVSVGSGTGVLVDVVSLTGVDVATGVAVSVGWRVFVDVALLTGVCVDTWATLSSLGVFSDSTTATILVGDTEAVAAISSS